MLRSRQQRTAPSVLEHSWARIQRPLPWAVDLRTSIECRHQSILQPCPCRFHGGVPEYLAPGQPASIKAEVTDVDAVVGLVENPRRIAEQEYGLRLVPGLSPCRVKRT